MEDPKEKNKDVERIEIATENRSYPKSIIFILIYIFFNSYYSYYGMRFSIVLYFKYYLEMNDDTATAVYHFFYVFLYLFPLVGAFIADSWLGKYKTILYLSIACGIGMILNTLGAVWNFGGMTLHTTFSMIGFFVMVVCGGGIRPCLSAFGGDQFYSDQPEYRRTFFSLFYFMINFGTLLSGILSSVISGNVTCFGRDDCYAFVFGVQSVLMIIVIGAFTVGTKFYIIKLPEANIFSGFFRGIGSAIKHRWNTPRKERNKDHWMDYALVNTNEKMVRDIKYVLRILLLYIPLPFFWTFVNHQVSIWTYQATNMDNYIGSIQVESNQLYLFHLLLIVALIPLLEATLYPCLRHFSINFTPLCKMTLGMVLAGLSFIAAAIVQLQMDATMTKVPDSYSDASFRIINGADCTIEIRTIVYDNWSYGLLIQPGETTDSLEDFIDRDKLDQAFDVEYNCPSIGDEKQSQQVLIIGGATWNMVLSKLAPKTFKSQVFQGITEKSGSGAATVRIFNALNTNVTISGLPGYVSSNKTNTNQISEEWVVEKGDYTIVITTENGSTINSNFYFDTGGDYTVLLWENGTEYQMISYTDVSPNDVSICWLIPQYFLIALGEIFLYVTGLEFSYTQAPTSMKTVATSFWLFMVPLGDIIILIINEFAVITNLAVAYFVFAGLIGVTVIAFVILAFRYDYVDESVFYEEVPPSERVDCEEDEDYASTSSFDRNEKNQGAVNSSFEDDYTATSF